MLYLISYDITANARRNRTARLLEGFGQRVLESVFECDLTPAEYTALRRRLARRIKPEEGDHLRIYRLCEGCVRQVDLIGAGPPIERSPMVYII